MQSPDRLLAANKFDREIWQVGDEVWCVQRPRTAAVAAAALWLTFAGFSLATALTCVIVMVAAHERGGGWYLATILLGAIGSFAASRGLRALAEDRAIKRRPLTELPRLRILKERGQVIDSDGTITPLAQVRHVERTEESGEGERFSIDLILGEHRFNVMHAARDNRLDETRNVLGQLTIRRDKS